MAYTIAVAGKGGTGKTTVSSLILAHLLEGDMTPVLAIDADPNTNLNQWLGVKVDNTVGDLQAEVLEKGRESLPAGMDRRRYLQYQMRLCLQEYEGFDLLAMGRTEGPGCYCSVNDILRAFMDELVPNYEYVLMDNEAGMEHLSRRTTRDVDLLLIVSDENPVGIRSAGRINAMRQKLEVNIDQAYLMLNRMRDDDLSELAQKEVQKTGLEVLARLPFDEKVAEFSLSGDSLLDLPADSPARRALGEALSEVLP